MRIGTGIKLEYISSAWMIVEVIGSIGFGLIAGSFALLAFGGDSLIELFSGFTVLTYLRRDASGSEMHSKRTEQLTSALLFSLIPIIGLGAVYSYISGIKPEGSPLGIAVAIGAVVVMPFLWFEKKKIGQETRSSPLSMDAIESVTCLFMAVALLGGLLGEFFLGLWWVDYLATGVILAFVTKEAIESYRELHEERKNSPEYHWFLATQLDTSQLEVVPAGTHRRFYLCNTINVLPADGRNHRRTHHPEFKRRTGL